MIKIIFIQFYSIIIGIFFLCKCIFADYKHPNIELQKVLSQITNIQNDIKIGKKQQVNVQSQLNKLKQQMQILNIELQNNTNTIKKKNITLNKLENNKSLLQNKSTILHNKILLQIYLMYTAKKNDDIIIHLLNTSNNKIMQQMLIYHKYLGLLYLAKKQNLNRNLHKIFNAAVEIKQETNSLKILGKARENHMYTLESMKIQRNQILQGLNDKIIQHNAKLQQLLQAKSNLEKLILSLSVKKTIHKHTIIPSGKKHKLCENFIQPVKGKIIIHFGSPIENSTWKWNGLVISALENQEVHAIHAGTVVYADRLAGYGLLIIIDHGNNDMSLYGYNKNLKKKLNEKVNIGEIISNVGKDNNGNCGLYFAIRHNGKPIDPEKCY